MQKRNKIAKGYIKVLQIAFLSSHVSQLPVPPLPPFPPYVLLSPHCLSQPAPCHKLAKAHKGHQDRFSWSSYALDTKCVSPRCLQSSPQYIE